MSTCRKNNRYKAQNEPGKIEANMIRLIDMKNKAFETFTDDELTAIEILIGKRAPTEEYSRQWAVKIGTQLLQCDITGKLFALIYQSRDRRDIIPYLEFFVPKAKQTTDLNCNLSGSVGRASTPNEPSDFYEWLTWAKHVNETAGEDLDSRIAKMEEKYKAEAGEIKAEDDPKHGIGLGPK